MAKKTKTIRIVCKGSRQERLDQLEIIQGELKELSSDNMAKLRKRIESKGFDAPFFVWRNKILDGTQRKKVLDAMMADGWILPEGKVPVCDIEAASLDQAKDRLLGYVSQYGHVTDSGLAAFLDGIEGLDLGSLELPGLSPAEDNDIQSRQVDLQFAEISLKPYKKTHVLLSFAPELFARVSEHLERIVQIEGVEYEQGSNG